MVLDSFGCCIGDRFKDTGFITISHYVYVN